MAWSRRLSVLLLLSACMGCRPATEETGSSLWSCSQEGPYTVRITGQRFRWLIRHPGGDGQLDTDDDIVSRRDLHLPADTPIHIFLASEDYLYTLELPKFGVKEIAVPELSFSMSFETSAPGQSALLGDQMCGYQHPDLLAKLEVMSHQEFSSWLAETATHQPQAAQPLLAD